MIFRGLPTEELIYGSKGDSDIILFDRTGRLISRHRFKGDYVHLDTVDGVMYAIETQYSDTGRVEHVWRLDKI